MILWPRHCVKSLGYRHSVCGIVELAVYVGIHRERVLRTRSWRLMGKDPDRKDTITPESVIPSGSMLPDFEAAFGEPLSRTLDLSTWTAGEDLASAYARLEQEVSEAVAQEDTYGRRFARQCSLSSQRWRRHRPMAEFIWRDERILNAYTRNSFQRWRRGLRRCLCGA